MRAYALCLAFNGISFQSLLGAAILISSAILSGCGGDNATGTTPAGAGAPAEQAASPPQATPERGAGSPIREGGALKLNTPSGPVDVPVEEAQYVNTDEGYSDYVEVWGNGLSLMAQVGGKVEENDQEQLQYQSLAGKPLPIQLLDPENGEPMTIEIPGSGSYTILGGVLVVEKFEHGPSTVDRWQGRVDLTLQTVQGPIAVTGTFSFGIVPVW